MFSSLHSPPVPQSIPVQLSARHSEARLALLHSSPSAQLSASHLRGIRHTAYESLPLRFSSHWVNEGQDTVSQATRHSALVLGVMGLVSVHVSPMGHWVSSQVCGRLHLGLLRRPVMSSVHWVPGQHCRSSHVWSECRHSPSEDSITIATSTATAMDNVLLYIIGDFLLFFV